MLGYVFDEGWANDHQSDVLAFVHASRKAKDILASSDTEWQRLRPLMKAADDATFAALRDGYRRGIPSIGVRPSGGCGAAVCDNGQAGGQGTGRQKQRAAARNVLAGCDLLISMTSGLRRQLISIAALIGLWQLAAIMVNSRKLHHRERCSWPLARQ